MIAALLVPEHCLSFYFVCDDGLTKFKFPVLLITQNGESSCDLLLSVTNRKALAPGVGGGGEGARSPRAPFKTLITLLLVTFSQLDQQLGVGWGKRFVL